MRLMVTGGAGFIGSAVIRYVLKNGSHSVLNLDKLTYAANLANLDEVLPNNAYTFIQADICDAPAVERIFEQYDPDAVMHLAAESHVDRSIDGPADFIRTNILGTYTMLQAARKHFERLSPARKQRFRFHHISTDEVFGSLGKEGLFNEKTPYAPNSPYSSSKASSDMLVRAWYHTFGLPTVTSNCSNNYGPYQFPEKLIPVVIIAALEGRPIPVYGAGTNVRDWLYVEDHAIALMTVLEHGTAGETYNIGGNAEMTNIELVRLICRAMDEALPQSRYCPHDRLIQFVADRPGHDQRYAIDASKIARELGWRPRTDLESGIRNTVKWYLDNRPWWQAIRDRGFKDGRLGLAEKTAPSKGFSG
jgi:dTDP-glucose 4,6-dehydratase